MSINKLRSNSMFQIPIVIEGFDTRAVLDTGAEVSIMSDEVYKQLQNPPPIIKAVKLNTAGRDMVFQSNIVGPVRLELGSKTYSINMYVGPIEDDILLGLDFLKKNDAKLDLSRDRPSLKIEGECLSLHTGKVLFKTPEIARVSVNKRTVVPPNSVALVKCSLNRVLKTKDFFIEPPDESMLLIPRTLHNKGSAIKVCCINISSQNVVLQRDSEIAYAMEVYEITSEEEDVYQQISVCSVTPEGNDNEIPSHVKCLIDQASERLTEQELTQFATSIIKYADVFAKDDFDLGNFQAMEHSIDTNNAKPRKQKLRRTPACFVQEEEKHLQKMLDAKVIEPSISAWASNPVLIRKRDGGVRWCIDYRNLNAVTEKDVFPLPLIEECIDTLAGNSIFSKLDANSAYWQVPIKESDRSKTAFNTKHGLFQFVKMSFGLCNAPATYSRIMQLVLRGLTWKIVLAFMDDILVMGKNFAEHLCNLEAIFERFRRFQLKLKPSKCEFLKEQVEFLGRMVSKNGLEAGDKHIKRVGSWPSPKTTKEVEQFLGFANYHRSFIQNYAHISNPLYKLTGKNKFVWEDIHEDAFCELKKALTSTPVLALPTKEDQFVLDTDASNDAIGGELLQIQNREERTISFASFSLTHEQIKYCTTRKELLAVVRMVRHFRHYLLGRHFVVRTDHSSLQWLMNFRNPQTQLARWLEELGQYNMTIVHRPGKQHQNADGLSRIPQTDLCGKYRVDIKLEDLPCGGCSYCTRAQGNWQKFLQNVDEAVPLTMCANLKISEPEFVSDIPSSEITIETSKAGIFVQTYSEQEPLSLNVIGQSGVQLSGYSATDIRDAQGKDPDLSLLLRYLKDAEEISDGELLLSSKGTKYYWINRELYSLDQEGVLWRKPGEENGEKILVVPVDMKEQVLELCHNIPSSGHQGINRTEYKVRQKYHWYKLGADIQKHVKSCAVCNKNKKPVRKARCPLTSYQAGEPMERVHLDFLGPLPRTAQGNEFVMMMVDQFSKWTECIALPSQTAEVTARAAVNEFFSRFGYPFTVFTDQGRNFESHLFKSICEVLKIHKTRTTAYRPSGNGQVERYNRTLLDALRCFVQSQEEWDIYLPQLAGALRSTINRQTGFTANKLMLGREINQPADLFFRPPETGQPVDPDNYVEKLQEKIRFANETARKFLKTSQKNMKRDYDIRIHESQYKEGDCVYILEKATKKGQNPKLQPIWKGPGFIMTRLSPYVYRVRLEKTVMVVNHDRIKMCTDKDFPRWLKEAKAKTATEEMFCVCNGPDTGSLMIYCDFCFRWFHTDCVDVTEIQAEELEIYRCPNCSQ